MVLPDTSVWVQYLREGSSGNAAELGNLLETREAMCCGPVAAELIGGAREPDRNALWRVLGGLPWARLERREWRTVGTTAGALRARGETVPLTDVMIGVAAAGAGATVWTADSDFDRLAHVLDGLTVRRL